MTQHFTVVGRFISLLKADKCIGGWWSKYICGIALCWRWIPVQNVSQKWAQKGDEKT